MIIKKVYARTKDKAIVKFECTHCGATMTRVVVCDEERKQRVLPNLKCGKCGRSEDEKD